MGMRKKYLLILLCVYALSLFCVGCGGNTEAAGRESEYAEAEAADKRMTESRSRWC